MISELRSGMQGQSEFLARQKKLLEIVFGGPKKKIAGRPANPV
jgi:hypothetical protein